MSSPNIDLDSETIQLDGQWCTRDELARKIKSMLDAGDYAISRHSAALEQLNGTLAALRTLAFRALPEMYEALNAAAGHEGKTIGAILREAVNQYLGSPASDSKPASAPEPPGLSKHQAPVMPAIAGPGALKAAASPPPLPSVVVDRSAIVTEEASPEDAAQAVSLTPKKKEEDEAIEKRWFGG
ncbi:MAG: hypothetical protein HYZ28_22545 [Myxococcales bacterium]|nr:hypothetical protein [Myxococcales bacterium]